MESAFVKSGNYFVCNTDLGCLSTSYYHILAATMKQTHAESPKPDGEIEDLIDQRILIFNDGNDVFGFAACRGTLSLPKSALILMPQRKARNHYCYNYCYRQRKTPFRQHSTMKRVMK